VEEAKQGCRSLKASCSKIGDDPTKKKIKSRERSKIPTGPWFPSLFLGSLEKVLAHLGSWRLVQKGGGFWDSRINHLVLFSWVPGFSALPLAYGPKMPRLFAALPFLFRFVGSWFMVFLVHL
jgi:hypothetical protein